MLAIRAEVRNRRPSAARKKSFVKNVEGFVLPHLRAARCSHLAAKCSG